MAYIHELSDWPHFNWNARCLEVKLAAVRYRQGRMLGRLETLGIKLREEASLKTLTEEVVRSSEIEGEILDRAEARYLLARRLGMDVGALEQADLRVEGVVDMVLDATRNYGGTLTTERLFGWHAALFPAGYSGLKRITAGNWRTKESEPMRVVSGAVGHERIHFEAPAAGRLDNEMAAFLSWLNDKSNADDVDPVLRAAVAHLWFVTIHPFEDGNGRIARAIVDMMLARSEQSSQRFYSMSAQICKERGKYYDYLEETQKGNLDITKYMDWFLDCMNRAFDNAEATLTNVLKKARFWECHIDEPFNDRQRKIINLILDDFKGKLTSSKWAKIAKCSQDTAGRDIDDLVKRHILKKNSAGGRSSNYSLVGVDCST